jgi:hypothetical protein
MISYSNMELSDIEAGLSLIRMYRSTNALHGVPEKKNAIPGPGLG